MRTDEKGNECPATLGEYRDLCAAIGGPGCDAVVFLDKAIEESSVDAIVMTPDAQMRAILMPLLASGAWRGATKH